MEDTITLDPFCVPACSWRLHFQVVPLRCGGLSSAVRSYTLFWNKLIPFVTLAALAMPKGLQPFTFLTCSQICMISVSNWVCMFCLMRMRLWGMTHTWHMFILMGENYFVLKICLHFWNWIFWQIGLLWNGILNEYLTIHYVGKKPYHRTHMQIKRSLGILSVCAFQWNYRPFFYNVGNGNSNLRP